MVSCPSFLHVQLSIINVRFMSFLLVWAGARAPAGVGWFLTRLLGHIVSYIDLDCGLLLGFVFVD